MKDKTNSWISGLAALVLAGASLFAGNSALAQAGMIYVKTELPRKTMVAGDGRTHRVNVEVDSTGVPTKKIRDADWKFWYNEAHFDFVDARKPSETNPSDNPNDFFYDFFMDPSWNFVDNTPVGGFLDANARRTDNSQEGSLDRIGNLAYLEFTTKSDISDTSIFFVYGEIFSDTTGSLYGTSYGNGVVTNDEYTILSPSELSQCDIIGNPGDPRDTHPELPDGDVDLHDYTAFAQEMTGPVIPRVGSEFDFNGEERVDLKDFAILQTAFSGDDIPATN